MFWKDFILADKNLGYEFWNSMCNNKLEKIIYRLKDMKILFEQDCLLSESLKCNSANVNFRNKVMESIDLFNSKKKLCEYFEKSWPLFDFQKKECLDNYFEDL